MLSTYIITSIIARPVLVIMSVSTFKITVILYIYKIIKNTVVCHSFFYLQANFLVVVQLFTDATQSLCKKLQKSLKDRYD